MNLETNFEYHLGGKHRFLNLMNEWAVFRLDYNSNEFLVKKGLTKSEAERLAEEYYSKGHHQHYWVDKQPPEDPDFEKLLSDMLKSGSSPEMAIRVLLSQGASPETSIQLMMESTGKDLDECERIVRNVSAD